MCNLYSLTKGQAAIRDWFRAGHDRTGNLPLFLGIFPTKWLQSFAMEPAASVSLSWRVGACRVRRSLAARRSPIFAMSAARTGAAGSANIIAVSCPEPRFANMRRRSLRKTPKWFALSQDRPLFGFAGLWIPWRGVRGPKERARSTASTSCSASSRQKPNAVVAPIHPKAMPVILTTPAEIDLWLLADAPEALELQRPLPDDALRIVASGEKEDGASRDGALSQDQEPMLPL